MPFLAEATPAAQKLAERREATRSQRSLHYKFSLPASKEWRSHQGCFSTEVQAEAEGIGGGWRGPEVECGGDETGIAKMREALLVHLRKAVERNQPEVPPPGLPHDREHQKEPDREADLESSTPPPPSPWSTLRTRRRSARASSVFARQSSTLQPETAGKRPSRLDRRERLKISVALTSEEIDEDIYAVTGYRARRRPRRRPRVVQKQLDLLFPGSWLSEITIETYRVPD
ncbi:uncharacterized protein LOC122020721 isoform X1 [Zingiber officinale]|uniref:DUF1639 family protein n=2 Tax=Zingiber officinale TaxID=94328 RepID=A0A8J5F1L3_ZINOF|nr:uncharacterized protein LOC122020721 isoform X1 [Zingiber officinale]KAG6479331.1 hypothetical protein ZIOFF_062794 [Zingiber officinale]